MQIIIPMSGFGERFRKAGYKIPKPLIKVNKRPIISYVIDMFPGESDFIFICNQEHLKNSDFALEKTIKKYCPSGRIVSIAPHKLGPVHAVTKAFDFINNDKPVVVNYCDFSCYWDWNHFKDFVSTSKCDAAIPAYKGFHPHSLGTTNYAYIKESNNYIYDIQEKKPFTNNRMNEYASSGTYYYSSGLLMKDSFVEAISNDFSTNGEFYVSLSYKNLIKKNKEILLYPIQHFMQWGTPEDLNEYQMWSNLFDALIKKKFSEINSFGSLVVPMAGQGQRFVDEGYNKPKPMIKVTGEPMVIQSVKSLPKASHNHFILRSDMNGFNEIRDNLNKSFENCSFTTLSSLSKGQATSAFLGIKKLLTLSENTNPITIAACDNGVIYDYKKLEKLLNDPRIDIIVWGVRQNPNAIRRPKMFGWIDEEKNIIKNISVKKPLKKINQAPIVIGTFTFKKSKIFFDAYRNMTNRKGTIGEEYYVDSMINDAIKIGMKCIYFEVDNYISWGTPNDLKTFEYWQSCFHKWKQHKYNIKNDQFSNIDISEKIIKELNHFIKLNFTKKKNVV
jgi:NDP-sugar pyrophosphorylase family protein